MASERKKRCTACGTRQAFSADLTKCTLCGSRLVFINPARTVGKSSGKGGGKSSGDKGLRVLSEGSTAVRKVRKRKSPKKWDLLKDPLRKDIGRKR